MRLFLTLFILVFLIKIKSLSATDIFPLLFEELKSEMKRSIDDDKRAAPSTTTETQTSTTNTKPKDTVSKTTKKAKKLPFCDDDKLMVYLADIQAINPESIINLCTVQDIDTLCNKVSDNLDQIDDYLKTCEPASQKDLYIQLIKGVNTLYNELCTDTNMRSEFELHFHCLKDIGAEYEECSGPADWTEDMSEEKVCAAYKDIIDCYFIKTAIVCGRKPGHMMRELSKLVVGSVLTHKCHNLEQEPKLDPSIPDEVQDGGNMLMKSGMQKQKKESPGNLNNILYLKVLLALFIYRKIFSN